MSLLKELFALAELKNHMDETEYTTWDSWRKACRKANSEVTFEGDKDIAQALVGKRSIGEWDGAVGTVFKVQSALEGQLNEATAFGPGWKKIDDNTRGGYNNPAKTYRHKDGREIRVHVARKGMIHNGMTRAAVQNFQNLEYKKGPDDKWQTWGEVPGGVSQQTLARVFKESIQLVNDDTLLEAKVPAWFKDGAKVKMMPDYADSDPNEVFTLNYVDGGKGRVSDDQGRGWNISYFQVYPKNKTPAIHEAKNQSGRGFYVIEPDGSDAGPYKTREAAKTACTSPKDKVVYGEINSHSEFVKLKEPVKEAFGIKIDGELWMKGDKPVSFDSQEEAEEAILKSPSMSEKNSKVVPLNEGLCGVAKGQVYVPADGAKDELTVLSVDPKTEDATVKSKASGKEYKIDCFKLAKVRYSLKEDENLQALGRGLKGTKPAVADDDVEVKTDVNTTPADKAAADAETNETSTSEFKVGDKVTPNAGPHKGQVHSVIHVFPDGRVNLTPDGLKPDQIKYRLGAVTARPDQITLAESRKFTGSLLAQFSIMEAKAGKDGFLPMGYGPKKGHTIEAYGRKGMKNEMWRKMFKDQKALEKWLDDNDATLEGSRDLDANEKR
jgi:hypothetical protein